MDTNPAIPGIVNQKVRCPGKIEGLGLHPQIAARFDVLPGKQTRFDGRHGVSLMIYSRDSYRIPWRPPFCNGIKKVGVKIPAPSAAQPLSH